MYVCLYSLMCVITVVIFHVAVAAVVDIAVSCDNINLLTAPRL